jgi:hypothetical protein
VLPEGQQLRCFSGHYRRGSIGAKLAFYLAQ